MKWTPTTTERIAYRWAASLLRPFTPPAPFPYDRIEAERAKAQARRAELERELAELEAEHPELAAQVERELAEISAQVEREVAEREGHRHV